MNSLYIEAFRLFPVIPASAFAGVNCGGNPGFLKYYWSPLFPVKRGLNRARVRQNYLVAGDFFSNRLKSILLRI